MLEFLICVVIGFLVAVYHVQVLALVLAIWALATHLHLFMWMAKHPWLLLSYVSIYFVVGAGWSVAKWILAEREKLAETRRNYEDYGETRTSWEAYKNVRKTKVSAHYEDFLIWIGFWPFSFIFTMLDDPLRKMCRAIYNRLVGVYQRITDSVWS